MGVVVTEDDVRQMAVSLCVLSGWVFVLAWGLVLFMVMAFVGLFCWVVAHVENYNLRKRLGESVVRCPKCERWMRCLGNLSGVVLFSKPPQWDETYACHACKVKTVKRVRAQYAGPTPAELEALDGYETVQESSE